MSDAGIFPFTARANATNHLELGGCDTVDLAKEFGTPLYVFDDVTLRRLAAETVAAFQSRRPDSIVLYATKAYFSPFLARLYNELGLGLDVTSEGELGIVRRVGFPARRVYLHGNNKTEREIRTARAVGVERIVIDNLDEIELISRLLGGNAPAQLLLRISPDIDPHTHRHLTTGVAESKFGLGIGNGQAAKAYEVARLHPGLNVIGLHAHIGSQISEVEPLLRAFDCLLDLAAEWQADYGFRLRELDIGGGWAVPYTEEQAALTAETVAERVCSALAEGLAARGLEPDVKLLVEPGRALIARAGVALYRVGSIKVVSSARTYAAVDGGMGDNIRPALYGARYTARAAHKFDSPPSSTYAIAGRYCEQGDVLIDSVRLPELEPGDVIAVPVAGAYQLPMASNYNLIPRPAVVLVRDGQARLLRRRETLDDLLACDTE